MLYTICVALIVIASILIILAVLVQNPKSGMAANFGASNQVMGVRETTNFLEKFTWTMAIAILVLSLVATTVMDTPGTEVNSEASKDAKALQERMMENAPARSNVPDKRFNAPSRAEIYKVAMELAFPDWKFDYETFVKFDLGDKYYPLDKTNTMQP